MLWLVVVGIERFEDAAIIDGATRAGRDQVGQPTAQPPEIGQLAIDRSEMALRKKIDRGAVARAIAGQIE